MIKRSGRVLGLVIIISILTTLLSGCVPNESNTSSTEAPVVIVTTASPNVTPKADSDASLTDKAHSAQANTEEPVTSENVSNSPIENLFEDIDLNSTQQNSVSMLNYLAVLTQEINASKNSRIYLEEAYSSLINNTYPNAVDGMTLIQLASLLDTLEAYRMVAVKRDRLQFIYEQNRAQALRAAIPNPLGLLSATKSHNLASIVASIAYLAVDSYSSYTAFTSQNDLQFLKDGWVLDDEAAKELHNSRKSTFNYMVRIVDEYNLPGDLTLNEKAVEEFVTWKNNTNAVQRIQFLESNMLSYMALGKYWLTLAESYYSMYNYGKCLEAVSNYERLGTRIFRKDYELAKVLPLAIISAGEIYTGDEYIKVAEEYVEKIIANTDHDTWDLRYFAAQTYVQLSATTNNSLYLEKAYEIVLNNVNTLINQQKRMNVDYLADFKETEVPKGATKAEKADIDNYNKQIKQERETALAPIYEPLLLNCDLLFSLANQLNISEDNKQKIETMLHENDANIFLIDSLDSHYRFTPTNKKDQQRNITAAFNGTELSFPAKFVTSDAVIRVTVAGSDKETIFTDWEILKVDRKENNLLDSFIVTYKSANAKDHKYKVNENVNINILPKKGHPAEALEFKFVTDNQKKLFVFDNIVFKQIP